MEQRKHDWLATLFFSPDKTIQDFADYGITTENSSIQNPEYYKNLPQIQEAFKTESGNFDDAKFNSFYNDVLYLYNVADKAQVQGDIFNTFTYDPDDYLAPIGAKRRDVTPSISLTMNPERRSAGLVNIREISDPTMSMREVGQTQQVFNWDTQQFEDWTPNERGGLLGGWSMPTLVLAQWDEDGIHEFNGRTLTHKKGDLKFNEYGDPYYETLGNRPIEGKDLLHYGDVLTTDGSAWNKYDFFDSDGLDKSIGGTIMKTAVKLAPMFIPGVNYVYGGITAALELGEVLPLLYKGIVGIAAGDISNIDSVKTANNIQGYFSRFNSSQSDYARQAGFFTVENLGEIAAMAAMQLGQQKVIAKIPEWFGGYRMVDGKKILTENAIKWGRGLSFAYMSGTSAQHSYEAFKEAGASDRAAGLGMIATALTFYGLMSNNYFNYEDVLFGNSQLSKSAIKQASLGAGQQAAKQMGMNSIDDAIANSKGAAKWVLETQKKLTEYIKKMEPTNILSTSFKEGVEETMEEVFTDSVKGAFAGLNALGLIDKNTEYNFGFSAQDMATRYFTSFIGGGIGGGVFGVVNKFDPQSKPIDDALKTYGEDNFQKIVYLFRNGKEKDVRQATEQLWRQGKYGSRNLSGSKFRWFKSDKTPELIFDPAENGESQNDTIYKGLIAFYDRISGIIKEEGLNISDEDIQTIISARPDLEKEDAINFLKSANAASNDANIFSLGLHTQAFQDINTLATQIVQKKAELEAMLSPKDLDPKTNTDINERIKAVQSSLEYQKLHTELEALRDKRKAILSGQYNDKYMGLMHYAGRPQLVQFMNNKFGVRQFTEWKHGKYYDALSNEEKNKIDQEYAEYAHVEKDDIIKSFELFTDLQNSHNTLLGDISAKMKAKESLHKGRDLYAGYIEDIQKNLTENEETIKALRKELPEGETTSPKIEELIQVNLKLKADLENGAYAGYSQMLHLSENALKQLKRPTRNSQDEPITPEKTMEYEKSYLNYLKYIAENGLYLDKYDWDLRTILQTYATRLQSNLHERWVDAVQNVENQDPNNPVPYDDLHESTYWSIVLPEINTFIEKLKEGKLDAIIDAYNNLKKEKEAEGSNIELESYLPYLIPTIGGQDFEKYLTILSGYKDIVKPSPVYDLIKSIAESLQIDDNIVELLIKYKTEFLNSPAVEDFIIQDSKALDKLKQLSQVVNIAYALVLSAEKNGYNSSINPYRVALKKSPFVEMSDVEIHNIRMDLFLIKSQTETLIRITEKNNSQKLQEHTDIEINMREKFLDLLIGEVDPTDPTKRKENTILKALGIDINDVIAKLNITIPEEVSKDTIKEVIDITSKIETEIYKRVQSKDLSVNDIVTRLIPLFNREQMITMKSTKLSKNKDAVITDYDQLLYFATILGAPSQNFYSRLNEVSADPKFAFAPIYSQEYAVRMIYSFVQNTELFNAIAQNIKILAKDSGKHMATKTPMDNLILILGGAGTGKSKGVASLALAILNRDDIAISAPVEEQLKNLSEAVTSKVSYTKDNLINHILGRNIDNNIDVELIKENETDADDIAISRTLNPKTKVVGSANQKLLVIDEISQYNRIEIELITKWAKQNGVKIIALGDSIQNSAIHTMKFKGRDAHGKETTIVKNMYSSFDDMFGIKAPRLTAPLRPSNIGKFDNTVRISTELEIIDDYYVSHPSINNVELDNWAEDHIQKNPITLKYFEDETTVYGDMIVDKSNLFNYIDKLSKVGTVAIITDDIDKYNTVKKEGSIDVIHYNKVQGREFDYIIIDKEFKNKGFTQLKDIYTLTQRSRKGSVIANRGIPTYIRNVEDVSASGNLSIEEKHITDFKKWKLSVLPQVSGMIDMKPYRTASTSHHIDTINNDKASANPSDTTFEADTKVVQESNDSNPPNTPEEIQAPQEPVKLPSPKHDVNIQTPNKIQCTALQFFEWFNKNKKDYVETIDDDFLSNGEKENQLLLLRAWFLYGHYKKQGIISNKFNEYITEILKSGEYEFKINNHILEVTINNQIVVPLLYIPDIESGDFSGEIEVVAYKAAQTFGVHSNKTHKIPQNKYMQFSKVYVYKGEKVFSYNEDSTSAELNSGQTFILVNADPFEEVNFESEILIDGDGGDITIQHPTVQLFKSNRVATATEVLNNAMKDGHQNMIHGTTAGAILGIAYKIDPETVLKNVEKYLAKEGNAIRLHEFIDSFIYGKDSKVVKTIDEFKEWVDKHSSKQFSIVLGTGFDTKFLTSQYGGKHLWAILNDFKQTELLIDTIDLQNGREGMQFKLGIFCNDIVSGDNGWKKVSDNLANYCIDKTSFVGNDFLITLSSNPIETNKDVELLNELNKQLIDLGITERHFNSIDSINSTITDINNEIRLNTRSPYFKQYYYENGKIEEKSVVDWFTFIGGALNSNVKRISGINNFESIPLKYQIISVTLQNNEMKYLVVSNKERGWEVQELNTNAKTLYDLWYALYQMLPSLSGYPKILLYVKSILGNDHSTINKEIIDTYLKFEKNIPGLHELVINYLKEKIKNEQC